MKKYITTYFYHDQEDLGANYGNIFLPLEKRNVIYWQTVYTLFFSSIICNRGSEISFALFTNVKSFPFRSKLEAFGVKIYDDLVLTSRNSGKWATVKFFFDVIEYIALHPDFENDDAFVMLDNDVLSMRSASPLFEYLQTQPNAIAYPFEYVPNKNQKFHGIDFMSLEEFGPNILGATLEIKRLIGGEFFCFYRNQIDSFNKIFLELRNVDILTTEEQILTLADAHKPWCVFQESIFRVWTTLKVFKIPQNRQKYIFLHFPSEKESGLSSLFNITKDINPGDLSVEQFWLLFSRCIPIQNPRLLYMYRLAAKIYYRLVTPFTSLINGKWLPHNR